MKVLVLGGAGFIGRHVVDALAARGHVPTVGSRRNPHGDPRVRQARLHHLTATAGWREVLGDFDAVVNAVGILRERIHESYDTIHHRAPAALAAACAGLRLRLVHVSALGLHETARSRFIRSKLAGERAIAASGADYTIVRPSLVDGEGGYGTRWIRWLARWPVHFTPENARGRIACVDARDLGEAIAVLCERAGARLLCEVELGGSALMTMREYLAATRPAHLPRAAEVAVPSWLARVVSHLCDAVHFSPFSFGHFELLQRDNVPSYNLLPTLLGRPPRQVGMSRPPAERWKPGIAVTGP